MSPSIDKRLEKLEAQARSQLQQRLTGVVHKRTEIDLDEWEQQARENMEKMMSFVNQARQQGSVDT